MSETQPIEAAIGDDAVAAFAIEMRGACFTPSDAGYDDARFVWNGSIDKHPAIIARCCGVADVIDAVNFARANDLLVAVRGGGHNVAGNSVCDGGIVIDLGAMNAVRVDVTAQRVRAAYGDGNYERLVEVKTKYDPEKFFRLNQNIRPKTA